MQKHPWQIAFAALMSVLAVVGWTLHWHVTNVSTKTVVQSATFNEHGQITIAECLGVPHGTKEGVITDEFGSASDNNNDVPNTLTYGVKGPKDAYGNPVETCTFTFEGHDSTPNADYKLSSRDLSVP